MNDVYIMCGGPSAQFIHPEGDIIAVNKDINRYPDANYFITMDHRYTEIPTTKATKIFVANLEPDYMIDGKTITDKRFGTSYDLSLFDVIIKSRRVDGFGKTFDDFRNGFNSGYCALQFAYIMGYKRIHLVGLDLVADDQTHWHDGYPDAYLANFRKNLEIYFYQFKEGLKDLDVEIISHSPISRLNDLEGVTYAEFNA